METPHITHRNSPLFSLSPDVEVSGVRTSLEGASWLNERSLPWPGEPWIVTINGLVFQGKLKPETMGFSIEIYGDVLKKFP